MNYLNFLLKRFYKEKLNYDGYAAGLCADQQTEFIKDELEKDVHVLMVFTKSELADILNDICQATHREISVVHPSLFHKIKKELE